MCCGRLRTAGMTLINYLFSSSGTSRTDIEQPCLLLGTGTQPIEGYLPYKAGGLKGPKEVVEH